jgi:hypothetical protein
LRKERKKEEIWLIYLETQIFTVLVRKEKEREVLAINDTAENIVQF